MPKRPKLELHPRRRAREDKRQQAEALVERARNASSDEDAHKLLRQAITVDGTMIDAHLMLMSMLPLDATERLTMLRRLVEIGADDLGPAYFDEHRGFFWLEIDSRPYLRARALLAMALIESDLDNEAIVEMQEILELNSNDNQGIRYQLLGLLLEHDRLAETRSLLDQFAEDASPGVEWIAMLERFLAGKLDDAAAILTRARERNPFVEEFLAARRRIPPPPEHGYRTGSIEQAQEYVGDMAEAWRRHPDAVIWLRDQIAEG